MQHLSPDRLCPGTISTLQPRRPTIHRRLTVWDKSTFSFSSTQFYCFKLRTETISQAVAVVRNVLMLKECLRYSELRTKTKDSAVFRVQVTLVKYAAGHPFPITTNTKASHLLVSVGFFRYQLYAERNKQKCISRSYKFHNWTLTRGNPSKPMRVSQKALYKWADR